MLEVTGRYSLARSTVWKGSGWEIGTPNIILHSHDLPAGPWSSFPFLGKGRDGGSSIMLPDLTPALDLPEQPFFLPLARESVALGRGGQDGTFVDGTVGSGITMLPNAFELRRDARAFVSSICALHRSTGRRLLLYAPGMMDPSNLAMLAYAGVDLFDSALIAYQAARGRYCTIDGDMSSEGAQGLLEGGTSQDLLRANLREAWRELLLVRHMISQGRLRELVEVRCQATTWGVEALRLMDLEQQELQEAYTPVVGPRFLANSRQSLTRPDVLRWRRRVMERWTPAAHKKVLLLIPCSAKKPYSTSKSHRQLQEVMASVPNHEVVQEMIVTSPLGCVPRELELYYPAAQYDIPVTGHWDLEESSMVREMVADSAAKGFEVVVCHLGHGSDLVKEAVDCLDTCQGGATSPGSLRLLGDTLAGVCAPYGRPARGAERLGAIASAARFQFGKGGEALAQGCQVMGSYPYSKIFAGRQQMGILTPERGMISLTLEGAERLMPLQRHWVEMEDFDLAGNLFAVGVRAADPGLRSGDEALVLRGGRLQAVGIAAMSSQEMVELKRGEAVRVRHKRKVPLSGK